MATIIMFAVLIALVWFMQRQQKKQAQSRQDQLNAIQKGDEVVTIGGLFAVVDEVDVEGNKVVLDVDGVYLTFELSAIKRIDKKAEAIVDEEQPAVEEITAEAESAIETDDTEASAIESK